MIKRGVASLLLIALILPYVTGLSAIQVYADDTREAEIEPPILSNASQIWEIDTGNIGNPYDWIESKDLISLLEGIGDSGDFDYVMGEYSYDTEKFKTTDEAPYAMYYVENEIAISNVLGSFTSHRPTVRLVVEDGVTYLEAEYFINQSESITYWPVTGEFLSASYDTYTEDYDINNNPSHLQDAMRYLVGHLIGELWRREAFTSTEALDISQDNNANNWKTWLQGGNLHQYAVTIVHKLNLLTGGDPSDAVILDKDTSDWVKYLNGGDKEPESEHPVLVDYDKNWVKEELSQNETRVLDLSAFPAEGDKTPSSALSESILVGGVGAERQDIMTYLIDMLNTSSALDPKVVALLESYAATDGLIYSSVVMSSSNNNYTNKQAYAGLIYMHALLQSWGTKYLSGAATEGQMGNLETFNDWNRAVAIASNAKFDAFEMLWDSDNLSSSFDQEGDTLGSLFEDVDSQVDDWNNLADSMYFGGSYDGVPLSMFFDTGSGLLSGNIFEGIAISSSYIPMRTNLYDPIAALKLAISESFMNDFHIPWGFQRKALYMDVSSNSATSYLTGGSMTTTKIATLEDLLYNEGDITLYIDDNFYNMKYIEDTQGYAVEYLDEINRPSADAEDEDGQSILSEFLTDFFTNNAHFQPDQILKTGSVAQYNSYLAENVTKLDAKEKVFSFFTNKANYAILDETTLMRYIDGTLGHDYTPMRSFAIVSGIYRHVDSYNRMNELSHKQDPVFISSGEAILGIDMVNNDDAYKAVGALYNYALLRNLSTQMPVGYNYSSDLKYPVYMDIYGNICTESGIVVVPAACNATLHDESFRPYAAGWLYSYGSNWKITYKKYRHVAELFEDVFELDEGNYELKHYLLGDEQVNVSRLSVGDTDSLQVIYNWYLNNVLLTRHYDDERFMNIIHEVIRGAPLDQIVDMTFEGLRPENATITLTDVWIGKQFENIYNALKGFAQKTMFNMPNPAFVSGTEVIIIGIVKVYAAIVTITFLGVVYTHSISGRLGPKTLFVLMAKIAAIVALVYIVPFSFEVSYYEVNKALLQKEAGLVSMLIEEKKTELEVHITEIKSYEPESEILIKLEDIQLGWGDLLSDVIFGSVFDTMTDVYENALADSFLSTQYETQVLEDGIYISTSDLHDMADVYFNLSYKALYSKTVDDPYPSYYLPYFVMLDYLIGNVNSYNSVNNIYAFTTELDGTQINTHGLVEPLFKSQEFLLGEGDTLGLAAIYDIELSEAHTSPFDAGAIELMQKSGWFRRDMTDEDIIPRIDALNQRARDYVLENIDLIGRVTDETFLKSMALDMALYHNKIFGITQANAYEIQNLSLDDVFRFAISDRDNILINAPMSLPRFTLTVGGGLGCMVAAIVTALNFAISILKPGITFVAYVILFTTVFLNNVLKNDHRPTIGYLITISLICLGNAAHAVVIKLSFMLPNMGFDTTVCLLLTLLIYMSYLFVIINILKHVGEDIRNVGLNTYNNSWNNFKDKFDRSGGGHHGGHRGGPQEVRVVNDDRAPLGRSKSVEEMLEQDERRSRGQELGNKTPLTPFKGNVEGYTDLDEEKD